MSSLGLQLDNKIILIAIGLRLGVPICRSQVCHLCGASIDSLGTPGLHCSRSIGHSRYSAVNEVIKRALASAKIAAYLELASICIADGKRPEGATVMPWHKDRILIWDVTCPKTFAPSH